MNILATLSVTDLNEVLKLRQEAEPLKARLAEIDAALAGFAEGKTAVPVPTAVVPAPTAATAAPGATAASEAESAEPKKRKMSPAVRAKMSAARKAWWATKQGTRKVGSVAKPGAAKGAKRGKHGAVKEAIIELVKKAGSEGITVKEIAAKLGTKYNRVFTWFYNTGKKIKDIKKVGPGKYRWVG